MLFGNFLFFFEKKIAKEITNNFKHKTLKTTFTFMSRQNTYSTKKAKSTPKKVLSNDSFIFQLVWLLFSSE
jgi:hypothetical protein